jgi:hypothetical protein
VKSSGLFRKHHGDRQRRENHAEQLGSYHAELNS